MTPNRFQRILDAEMRMKYRKPTTAALPEAELKAVILEMVSEVLKPALERFAEMYQDAVRQIVSLNTDFAERLIAQARAAAQAKGETSCQN